MIGAVVSSCQVPLYKSPVRAREGGKAGLRQALTSVSMTSRAAFGKALRKVRADRGVHQAQAARDGGVSETALNRAETGKSYPTGETLVGVLDGLGVSFHELARALDIVEGRVVDAPPGVARPAWVALLMRNGIRAEVLEGAALAAAQEVNGAADLVASAVEAARQLAGEAIAAVRRAELSLVAESAAEYDAGKGKTR